jgi:hypothetical protein
MTLLFCLAEWHALAKLRLHVEDTLNHLDRATVTMGQQLRSFKNWSREFSTVELPGEAAARQRRSRRNTKPAVAPHDSNSCSTASPNSVLHPLSAPRNAQTQGFQPTTEQPIFLSDSPNTTASVPGGDFVTPQEPTSSGKLNRRVKHFNLLTYKMHALGDYVSTIRQFGTTDSYSTQIVSSHPPSADGYPQQDLYRESLPTAW